MAAFFISAYIRGHKSVTIAPMQSKTGSTLKLVKAVLLLNLVPFALIVVYASLGGLLLEHAILAVIGIVVTSTLLVHPYLSNISALTEYVKKLAQDKKPEEPDLSFLNNLEELSGAVEELHKSWESRKNQLEAAVAENKIVIEVLPDALFILDKEQRIVRTNGMARQVFGHRILHRKLEEIIPVRDLVTTVENVRQVREIEFQVNEGDIRREYLAKVTKFPANSPSYTDTIITLHDLTEIKQIRRIRADFVANASHEMKTPLASIIGLIETLQTSAKDDVQARHEFLKIMGEQSYRMKTLIEDLLSLSKIEADTSPPDSKVDLLKILNDAKKHCEWAAKQKNVAIRIGAKNELPQVMGDENQLSQVFINLIQNAIKYGYADSDIIVEAGITRKLPMEMGEKYDMAVEVAVTDKSEGISPQHIPRLTERFYRVDAGRTKKLGGTGLGLAIVKHTLNRHNGQLQIKSQVGKGSSFIVYLPVQSKIVVTKEVTPLMDMIEGSDI